MSHLLKNKSLWTGVAALVVVVLAVLYFQGQLTAGSESYHLRMVPGEFGRSRYGWSFGSRSLYLREGQTLVVSYDVKLSKGRFHVHLFKRFSEFGKGTVESRYISASGKGQVSIPIRESGRYRLILDGMPDGQGYDLEYSASWRAH